MGYSDEDLNNGNTLPNSEVSVWNSSSIYFDDEVVEYQGKHYKALRKTSTDIPGRCKAGTWKEVQRDYDTIAYSEDDSYEDEIITSKDESKATTVEKDNIPEKVKENSSTSQKTNDEVPRTAQPVQSTAKVNVKPVNTPIAKKKTLKEQQDEQSLRKSKLNTSSDAAIDKESVLNAEISLPRPIPRKMMMAPSDQNVVNDILKEIDFNKIKVLNPDESSISSNLILPQDAKEDSTLRWESSHPEVISTKGKVNCPSDGNDVAVNLSVTVSKNKTSATRFFTLWVKAQEEVFSDGECVDMVYDALDFDQIKGKNSKVSDITEDLELLTNGLYDTEMFWASKDRSLIDETGKCYHNNLSKNTRVRLYAIITKGNEERLKHFDLTLKI